MAEEKKKVKAQETDNTGEISTETAKPKAKKKNKRATAHARVVVNAGFNNTIVSIADEKGNILSWSSSGANGFKGTKKSTPYAAQVAAEAAMSKVSDMGIQSMEIIVKGLGSGRDQALRGLQANNTITITSITDKTSIPHGGCRLRKARRV